MAFEWQQFTVVGARFTRDPEPPKEFGKRSVIRFGIAFTGERRKVDDEWKDYPVFMDCEAWQGEYGPKLVDIIEKYGKKGLKVTVIGSLKMEEWEDKNGGKRRAIKLTVKEFIILDKVETGGRDRDDDDGGSRGRGRGGDSGGGGGGGGYGDYGGGDNDPIPF